MANDYDKSVGITSAEYNFMVHAGTYGEAVNKSLVDSHVFFITELFNVGILGLFSLVCLIGYVVVQQLKIIIRFKNGTDDINLLLFLTLISMLLHRVSGSLVVIPFLWFILGLSFGACKLYWSHPSINACKEIHNQ